MKIHKLFQKAAAVIMAAVTVFSLMPTSAFAATGDVGTITFSYTYDADGNAMRYNSGATINGYSAGGTGHYKYRMYVDGDTAFCIQPGVPLHTGNTLKESSSDTWDALSSAQQKAVGLALLYGYQGNKENLSGSDDEIWMATQTLVWEFVTGCRSAEAPYTQTDTTVYALHYGSNYPNSGSAAAYAEIVALLTAHDTIPSFMSSSKNGVTKELTYSDGRYTVTLTDTGGVLSEFDFTSSDSGVTVKKSGDTLTITSSEALDGSVRITATRNNVPVVSSSAKLIAYGDDTLQDVVTGVENADSVVAYLNLETPNGSLKLVKTSEDGVVAGITFTIVGDGVDQTVTTGSDGTITVDNLAPGTYTVTEQDIDRYETQASQTVTVVSGKTATVTFNNVLKRGGLSVTKTSEDGLVEGVTFHLYGTSLSGAAVDEYAVTGSDGIATFEDVLVGTGYTLEEAGTADWYIVPDSQAVTISWNEVTKKSVANGLKKGGLTVTKTSEDGLVEGVTFHLYGTSLSGLAVDEYATTDSTGVATFEDILIGTGYTLEEVDTAERYVVPDSQSAAIEWNKVTNKSFSNVLKKWRATVTKSDAETGEAQGDASLAGAVYGVYNGSELVDTYTTDVGGQFTTAYYVCGDDWSIREITPSEGYLLDGTSYHVGAEAKLYAIEYNHTSVDVTESIIKGRISIIKHTDNGDTQIETPEEGAEFQVYLKSAGSYDAAASTERDYLTCDEYGYAETKDLPYGVYTVHQVSGWEGRELISDFDVYICGDGQAYRYLINNADFESYIKIVKTDAETGKTIPYAGTGFQIYDPDGNLVTMTYTYPEITTIDTFYTNNEGCLITPEALEYGSGYSIVEVRPPMGTSSIPRRSILT